MCACCVCVCISISFFNFLTLERREAVATDTSASGKPVHIGFPMKEAVWRTNHGYDPKIRAHYMWNKTSHAYPWSLQRYMFIHDALVDYQKGNVKIGEWRDWLVCLDGVSMLLVLLFVCLLCV